MPAKDTLGERPELERLRELSARLGCDRSLVQASSGNTSVKLKSGMWIKASGKWLIHAEAADFLIPVQLERARRCVEAHTAIPETATNLSGHACASIETAMHAVLPHKVVVHVHSVNAIAWGVREDAPGQLSNRLSGLNWQWIPYVRSGSDLALNVQHVLSRFPLTNVLLLGNHGLVVCGETCESAEHLLSEVEKCLKLDPRPALEARCTSRTVSTVGSPCCLPECTELRRFTTDPVARRILSGGVLYPCQAIFLPSTVRISEGSPLEQLSAFGRSRTPDLIKENGTLCSREVTRAEKEMLIGLANVVHRIDSSAPLRYLSLSEVKDVLKTSGENYRRAASINCLSKASAVGN